MWTATSGHERTADHWPFGGGDCVVAPATAIWVKVTLSVERSIFTPVWVVDVLVQDRLIWLLPAAVAARLVGAVGGAGGALEIPLNATICMTHGPAPPRGAVAL